MDIKAMEKSKRSHTQHHQPRKPIHPSSKAPPSSSSSSSASVDSSDPKMAKKEARDRKKQVQSPSLSSNWDRYEDEGEEDGEQVADLSIDSGSDDPTRPAAKAAPDVVKPKSKGANFGELIAQAKESKSNYLPSFHDTFPGDRASSCSYSTPIEIDSNGEEVAEIDSRNARKEPKFRTGSYKPFVSGKPPKRQRKLTSTVWEHYEFLEPDRDGNLFCKCKRCGQVYPGENKYGTGNLKRRLCNCKKRNFRDIGQLLLESRSGSLGNRRADFDPQIFREMVACTVVRHDLPFQFTEYDGVKALFTYLNPDVKVFSRNTTRSDVLKYFRREKEKVRTFVQSFSGRISFTSDCWSSLNTDGYISLTAHYIDANWCLHKRILNFSFMPPPHNGVTLAEKILLLMKDWGVDKKVMSLTVENASSNDFCVDLLKTQLRLLCDGDYFHVRCCAHILNLIVKEGLKDVDESVAKVRECVKYCKGSQIRKQRFLDTCQFCDVAYTKGVRQDVPTQWNSTYLMLESALYYRKVFTHLEVHDENFQHCPRQDEWVKIEKICSFLKVFYEVTCSFSGSKYPTSNLYFPNVLKVRLLLKKEMESGDSFMRNMATRMFSTFDKYWSEFSTIMAIATVMDPRYKLYFAEWAYKKVFGDEESDELDQLKAKLFALFDHYAKEAKVASLSSNAKISGNLFGSDSPSKTIEDPFMQDFDQFSMNASSCISKSELETYLEEAKLPRAENFEVLSYWRTNQFRYPILSQMARDVLAIPLSTVASESAFNVGVRLLDPFRSSLKSDTVEAVICLRDWVYNQEPISVALEVNINDLCGDIMRMTLNEAEDGEDTSKSTAGSGVGHKYALEE